MIRHTLRPLLGVALLMSFLAPLAKADAPSSRGHGSTVAPSEPQQKKGKPKPAPKPGPPDGDGDED